MSPRPSNLIGVSVSHLTLLASLAATLLLQVPSSTSKDQRLSWVRNPRETNGSWVADPAHHLANSTIQSIDGIIDKLEREKSIEMAVVVLDSLDGLEPADAALLLHRRWGVGNRQRDNGIVFLWSPAQRKTYVSVGYGLEGVLPDARVGRILDDWVLPSFRAGNFDGGMLQGVQKLADAAREETVWRPDAIKPGRATSAATGSRGNSELLLTPLALLVLAGASMALFRPLWRRRVRRCPNGHGKMRLLSEAEDNAMLTREEGLEERLGSVDYDVWVCPQCNRRLVIPYKKWFSKYKECPKCRRRTCESRSVTLRAATTVSMGLRAIYRECQSCGFKDERREFIPQIADSSSSGGSGSGSSFGGGGGGGSSFGGGSAGGGGAGRSY
jgi:uncharacterized protein